MSNDQKKNYTVPGLEESTGHAVAEKLQKHLDELNELQLTLKHAHWNVHGPAFIGVHEMLDPQIELVRGYADVVAERIVTLGVAAIGTPGALVANRDGEDYPVKFGSVNDHLSALDTFYDRVIKSFRVSIDELDDLDQVTQDVLIGQTAELEKFQWFMRAHLDDQQVVRDEPKKNNSKKK